MSSETFTVDRPLIPGFERGAPNMLLCPQGIKKIAYIVNIIFF